eukprot:GEMP01129334.1.p1 GENE.GEMP01129334.1~~GEMP01129334.1.p1  ORF type:complete len:101 (+),score=18.69 GEMP01129334.1:173-475(+)
MFGIFSAPAPAFAWDFFAPTPVYNIFPDMKNYPDSESDQEGAPQTLPGIDYFIKKMASATYAPIASTAIPEPQQDDYEWEILFLHLDQKRFASRYSFAAQ